MDERLEITAVENQLHRRPGCLSDWLPTELRPGAPANYLAQRRLPGERPEHLPVRDAPQSVIGTGGKAPLAWRIEPLEGLLRARGACAPVCEVSELYQTGPLTALLLRPR